MAGASTETVGGESETAARRVRALWTPQPGPQANAIAADWCPCIFYGGGKFSGKTDFLLGDYLQDLERYREHWQGIIFRRALTEFTEMKLRADELFPLAGGVWREQKNQWEFPRYGRKIGDKLLLPILRFRYLENLKDIRLYEGHSYPWIGVDELGDWEDPAAFFRLFTFNRYGRHPIPNKRIRATGNPGGLGHSWIRDYFWEKAPLGSQLLWDEVLESYYMFILGTYRDNKIGMQNDPGYEKRMNRAGSPALVRALKEGDFSVVAGAFFNFSHRNVISPFPIPAHWTRYMSMDWGGCGDGDPFSIGWWAVSDGTTEDGAIPYYRRGTRIRYREWYGKGLPKVSIRQVAAGIKEREAKEPQKIWRRVAGGDIKRKDTVDAESILDQFRKHDIHFTRANMDRVPGWQKLNDGLMGPDPNDLPDVLTFNTCVDSIKVMASTQHSKADANDIEEFNDHIPDEWRYGETVKSWVQDKPESDKPMEEKFRKPTIAEMWALHERIRRGRR